MDPRERDLQLSEFKKLSKEEISKLAPEQLDHIENLLNDKEKNAPTQAESAIRGALQGATLGFSDEIEAGIRAGISSISQYRDNTNDGQTLAQAYNQELDIARNRNQEASDVNPMTYTSAEVAGGLATPGGVIAKAGKGVVAAIKTGATLGAINAVGKSNDKLSKQGALETATGATIGAAGGAVAQGLASGIQQISPSTQAIFSRMTGFGGKAKSKDLQNYLATTGQSEDQFFNKMINYKIGNESLIKPMDSIDDIAVKSKQALDQADIAKTAILDKANINLNEDEARNIFQQARIKLTNTLEDALSNTEKSTIQTALDELNGTENNLILNKINRAIGAKAEIPTFNLKDIYRAKQSVQNVAYSKAGLNEDSRNILKGVSRDFNNIVDNIIEEKSVAGTLPKDLAKQFKEVRLNESNLIRFSDATREAALAAKNKPIMPFYDMVKAIGAGQAALMAGATPQTAVAAASGLVALSKLPGVDTTMALMVNKISQAVKNDPGYGSKVFQTLASSANNNVDSFRKAVASEYSKLDLKDNPIDRNVMDVVNKQNSILSIADYENPEMAKTLRNAIAVGDEELTASAMDTLSKQPGLKKFFKPGMGFNGKVYDPNDKAQMLKELETAPISHVQRLQLKRNLINNNIIPQVQVEKPVDTTQQFLKRKLPQY